MSARRITVFFYGLFMDADLLRSKGVAAARIRRAGVQNFALVIGRRATLVPLKGARSYGVLMDLTHDELAMLYSSSDLQCYHPEALVAQTFDAESVPALCYNLSEPPGPEDRNSAYAAQLRAVLAKLDMPRDYIDSIR